jgi:hypothetical protein
MIWKLLEQGECCREMFAAGVILAKRLLAVGEVQGSECFLPAVAELPVHLRRLLVESRRVFSVSNGAVST